MNRYRAVVIVVAAGALMMANSDVVWSQGVKAQPANQPTLVELQKQIDELKESFSSFKRHSAEIEESLSKASTTLLPVGAVVSFAGPVETIPTNWKICDGKTVSSKNFPVLWERIGLTWGGTSNDAFALPDLQGRFLRGVDGGSKRDPDASGREPNGNGKRETVGSTQQDALQLHHHSDLGHVHPISITDVGYHDSFACGQHCGALTGGGNVTVGTGFANISDPTPSGTIALRVSSETRVKNAYVYWIIRVN